MFSFYVFFFNDTATTEIYTLSLHDALPIFDVVGEVERAGGLLAGVPEHPDRLAVGGGHGHVHRVLDLVAPADVLDVPDRAGDGGGRVVLQPEGQGEVEQRLGVGGPLDLGVQLRVHGHHQVALDPRERG